MRSENLEKLKVLFFAALMTTFACQANSASDLGYSAFQIGMTKANAIASLESRNIQFTIAPEGDIRFKIKPTDSTDVLEAYVDFDASSGRLRSVNFYPEPTSASKHFRQWLNSMISKYGQGKTRTLTDGQLREFFCHGRFIQLWVTLEHQTAFLSYVHTPESTAICNSEVRTPAFEAVQYLAPPPRGNAPAPTYGAPAPSRQSSLPQPTQRGEYQDTLKCTAINMIFAGMSFPEEDKQKMRTRGKELFDRAVILGQQIGLTVQQITEDAKRYGQDLQSLSKDQAQEKLKTDLQYCNSRGMY